MKRVAILVLFVVLFVWPTPCFGQFADALDAVKLLDPAGTWYGGSNMATPYQMTIEPEGRGRFSVRAQPLVDYAGVGLKGWTDWTGTMTKGPGRTWDVYMMAFYVTDPSNPETVELDVVHSVFEFSQDYKSMKNTVDLYVVYLPWTPDKIPFVSEPDVNLLELFEAETLEETYMRMPTVCPICPHQSGATAAGIE